jgi:hypothetical protein
MGNSNSGRWHNYEKKKTVEECCILDIHRLVQEKMLRPGVQHHGTYTLSCTTRRENSISLDFHVNTLDPSNAQLQLFYLCSLTGKFITSRIDLQLTLAYFGECMWYFSCPIIVYGSLCARRSRKLYLPPGEQLFGCRHCHQLTYLSCQESHKYDRVYAELATQYDAATVVYLKHSLR